MTWLIDEEDEPKRFGVSRDERRARRQGDGREICHLDNVSTLVAIVGFNPYLEEVPNASTK